MSSDRPVFAGGRNIAMKVPPHLWEETVRFYRDAVGLRELTNPSKSGPPSVGFEFGANRLWIDRVVGVSQAELWLELTTDDTAAAARHMAAAGVDRCDDIEPLPPGLPPSGSAARSRSCTSSHSPTPTDHG